MEEGPNYAITWGRTQDKGRHEKTETCPTRGTDLTKTDVLWVGEIFLSFFCELFVVLVNTDISCRLWFSYTDVLKKLTLNKTIIDKYIERRWLEVLRPLSLTKSEDK